ncbi:ATP-binding protein [Motiliproteus sp. SC1-56]|uniref:ATP-binding protein n=1 Tax=Motiliproteus sp. SC1-56 TaxID=2799565 RepID=UPI001A8C8C8D|nr:ATP-binding protein [Motiliproteus sp. SC1-56]
MPMPMRSLYLKLFLAFWVVMMLVVAANMGLTWLLARHFDSRLADTSPLAQHANEALDQYRRGGPEALTRWRRNLLQETGLRVLLLDSRGRSLDGMPLPPRLHHHLQQGAPPGPRHHDRWRRRPISWTLENAGEPLRFVVLNPRELIDLLYSGSTLAWRLGLTVLIVALLSGLLARYLVRPVRLVQRASRALAEGDLQVRVGEAMGNRRDELGELGADFDRMAERLQTLLEGQQQLLRDVSHELRTPLARQRVAIELARRRAEPGEALDRIEQEAERLNALIEEILLLVRMDGAPAETPRETLDLGQLLEQLVDDANFEAPRVTLAAPGPAYCRGHPRQLHRALENIVRNALKYSEQAVEVTLTTDAGWAEISVCDRGPGLPEALQERVFDPFVRADPAREAEGWGLGLAIAAKAVRLHGGEISAGNRPGGGLCLQVRLPRVPATHP